MAALSSATEASVVKPFATNRASVRATTSFGRRASSRPVERPNPREGKAMATYDLDQCQLDSLLEEEARHWRDELHWDYRGALDLIKRFLEAHALSGCVAFENGAAAGYCFYVLEEQKGLIGGLYVSAKFPQETIGRRLLDEMLFGMRAIPHLVRIEAQLMPFSGPVDEPLRDQGFHLYTRQFMLLDLVKTKPVAPSVPGGMRLSR